MMWMIFGGLAFLLVIINLIRSALGYRQGWQLLMFLSLSFGALALTSSYQTIGNWIFHHDIAALEDVLPTMDPLLREATYMGIILNLVVLFFNMRKERLQIKGS